MHRVIIIEMYKPKTPRVTGWVQVLLGTGPREHYDSFGGYRNRFIISTRQKKKKKVTNLILEDKNP
jgi:hypothetical protein